MNENLIADIADRCASREVDALSDFFELGRVIVDGQMSYESARDQMVAAFKKRDMAASTAKTYVSQGYTLAQLHDTFESLTDWADAECNGSRSLKRLVDTARKGAKAEPVAAIGAGNVLALTSGGSTVTDVDRANAAIAILRGMSSAAAIAMVRDAAASMLGANLIAA